MSRIVSARIVSAAHRLAAAALVTAVVVAIPVPASATDVISTEDTEAPVVHSLLLESAPTVDVASGPATVSFLAHVTDDLSGDHHRVRFRQNLISQVGGSVSTCRPVSSATATAQLPLAAVPEDRGSYRFGSVCAVSVGVVSGGPGAPKRWS